VIARSIFEDQPVAAAEWWISLAAIAVIAGHIFPIWLRFRGGKGVATAVGVFLVLAPAAVGCAGIVFIMIVGITRYVSLGSIVAAAILPLFVWLVNEFVQPVPNIQALLTAAIAGAFLIIFAHRGNIGRLLSGNESKFR
jgi:glycerol-3-phosphate acyltransferase PlsY